MLFFNNICTNSSFLKIFYFIKELLNIIFILVPIGLILMIAFDFGKNVLAGKEDEMKKNLNVAIKKVMMAVIIFFIPTVVNFAIGILEDTGIEYMQCFSNANKEKILEYQEKEKIQKEEELKERKETDVDDLSSNSPYYPENGSEDIASANDYIKVLLIGNSYTYFNGYGEMVAKLAKASGKKTIVVRATRGGTGATYLGSVTLGYHSWYSYQTENESGNGNLDEIARMDFGKLNRSGSWDYIFLQNNDSVEQVYSGDLKIYNQVGNMVSNKKHFVFNSMHFSNVDAVTNRLPSHKKAAEEIGGSVVNTGGLYSLYSPDSWIKKLTVPDQYTHPSGKGQYLNALITYAKIYGVSEFAKSESDNKFIEVYNSDGGNTKEIATDQYIPAGGGNAVYGAMSVTKKDAKELQAFVYKNYKEYVLYY